LGFEGWTAPKALLLLFMVEEQKNVLPLEISEQMLKSAEG
jgi:hypothetical protein